MYYDFPKQQSKDELEQLSNFLGRRSEDQLCEVIDVFWKCWVVKEKFVRKDKSLQDEIDFELGVVSTALAPVKLEGDVPTADEWTAFAAIFKDMVKFNKLMSFQGQVAKYGMNWASKRLTAIKDGGEKKTAEASTGEYQEIKDPVHYWIGVLKNDKFGYDCSKREALFKNFFDECSDPNVVGNSEGSSRPYKITHVLKSGSKCCSGDRGTYRISKRSGGRSWEEQHKLKPSSGEGGEFLRQAEAKLVISGIVEEECEKLYPGNWIWPSVEGRFCHEVNKMFFGDTVNEKRFCRYEIPNARGYLRATSYI